MFYMERRLKKKLNAQKSYNLIVHFVRFGYNIIIKYWEEIKGDSEIAKKLQDGNKSDTRAESQN